jgi:hypothetical protein
MSEFRDDLLVTSIDKKRVIKIIIVAGLLLAAFAFSTVLFSLIGGSQINPNKNYGGAEPVNDVQLYEFPFPYNMSDFQNQFSDLNLSLDQLAELLNMFDGNIDDLNLNDFSSAMAALMGSEIEVFRVSNYSNFYDMEKKLWRYESFDEYNGTAWLSTAATEPADFYGISNYTKNYSDKDLLRIQMPLTANPGWNSMVIPSLFPDPC